jgi:hypothetical protein
VEDPYLNFDYFQNSDVEEGNESDASDYAAGGNGDEQDGMVVLHGRPTSFIDMEFVSFMRNNFIKWNVIADHLGVSRNTLRRRCQR